MTVTSKQRVPIAISESGIEARETDLGNYNVGFETWAKGDYSKFFHGLPHDQCQAEHHGLVLKGKLRYVYGPGKFDDIGPGQAYFIPPGHTFEVLEDGTEIVEFSPKGPAFDRTLEVVGKNMETWVSERDPTVRE